MRTPELAEDHIDPIIAIQRTRTRNKMGNVIGAGIGIMGAGMQVGAYSVARMAHETWETGQKLLRGAQGKPFHATAA